MLRESENWVLRWIFGSSLDDVTGDVEDCIMRSSMDFTLQHISFGLSNYYVLGGSCSTYGNQEICMFGFGRYNLFKGITFNSTHRWANIIKMYLPDVECGDMDWIERSFGFYKLRIVLWLSEVILHALERLCSVGFYRCSVNCKHLLKTDCLAWRKYKWQRRRIRNICCHI